MPQVVDEILNQVNQMCCIGRKATHSKAMEKHRPRSQWGQKAGACYRM